MNDLLFLGDFYYDYDSIQKDIIELGEYLDRKDYKVILNLEGAYKGKNKLIKWTVMSHNKKVLDALELLNVEAVTLANNHVLDWGEDGFKKIIRDLEEAYIPYFGAGLDAESALEPYIIEEKNLKIGFLGFCWDFYQGVYFDQNSGGIALLEEETVFKQIEKWKDEVDKFVIVVHWGYEYEKYPLPIHRELAHKCIEKGVDLIIGHHPHIIQVKEIYQEKPIYYSLGNFYFGSRREEFVDVPMDKTGTSKYGLGVVWNPRSEKTSEIFVESDGEGTRLKKFRNRRYQRYTTRFLQ